MGKEKTLKNVLTNLHQEFDFMNKYEKFTSTGTEVQCLIMVRFQDL